MERTVLSFETSSPQASAPDVSRACVRGDYNHVAVVRSGATLSRGRLWRHLSWIVVTSVMIGALLWPALWNGFPIVFDDTGGYLARPFEGTLLFGRSAFYGAFLALGIRLNFWPNVVAQSALIVWLVVLTLRTHGLGGRPWLAGAILIGLSGLTSLPWFASQLMPDVLVPVATLSIYLLAFRTQCVRRVEKILLVGVIAAAMASHMSTLALALALLAFLALIRPLQARFQLPRTNLATPLIAVALGVLLGPLSNLAIAGDFAFTPGGANHVFGRLIQSGIVARYLSEQCPDPTLRLCNFRDELPATGDEWLWGGASPLVKLGGTDEFGPEAQRIALKSLLLYPGQHLTTALASTAEQFLNIGIGYVMMPSHWYTRWTLERLAPNTLGSFLGSRQQITQLDLGWLSIIHFPIAGIAIIALPVFVMLSGNRQIGIGPTAKALAVMTIAALFLNAAICGSFAVPADRYQNRLAPLLLFAAALGILSWRRRQPLCVATPCRSDQSDTFPNDSAAKPAQPPTNLTAAKD
jgi:hypothetical protein